MPNSCIFQGMITRIKSIVMRGASQAVWSGMGSGRKWIIRTDFYSSSEPLTVYYLEAMTEF